MPLIKYAIADDHKIFRKGLRLALADDHRLKCIGEAEDGLELLELLKTQKADVLLLDLKMPKMDGLQVMQEVLKKYPETRILILTMYDDEHFILKMMEAGAHGYLVKSAEPEEIKTAIHSAYEDGVYISAKVSNVMLANLTGKQKRHAGPEAEVPLTEKEKEVLKLICQEYTTIEIGQRVSLSPRTVEGIRSHLLEKVGVKNTAGLVVYAMKHGIIEI